MIRIDQSCPRLSPSFNIWKACMLNDVLSLQRMLDSGENVNVTDSCGQSALHYATRFEAIDVLRFLVGLPNIILFDEEYKYTTPLHMVIQNCFNNFPVMQEMGKIIMEKSADVYFEHTSILVDVIKLYKMVPKYQHNDWLDFACMFLYYGANVYTFDYSYDNAITISVKLKCNHFFHTILPYITDFNMQLYSADDINKTLFMLAVEYGSPFVFYMIRNGADINFSNKSHSCLRFSIKHSKKLFVYMFTHCNDEVILAETNLIDDFLRLNVCTKKGFIHCINLMFDSKFIVELLDYVPADCIHIKFMSAFSRYRIPVEEQAKMLYSILRYNNTLSIYELFDIYKMCVDRNQAELFEIFMRVTVTSVKFKGRCLAANQTFKALCFPNRYAPKPLTKFPSLLSLSRDCIRKNIRKNLIQDKNNVMFKYYNHLLQMNLPNAIIDILTLKTLV